MSLQKGLVGHWPLDKESLQSATIFADKTPNENRGTSANAPVFTTDRMGQADRAMSFDGVSDYVDCGNDESLQFGGKNEIIISVWVYIEGLTGTDQEIIRQDSGYYVRITNSRQVYWKTYTSNEITTDDTITLKTWTHILSIYDGVNMKVYINGVLSKSVSSTGNIGSSTNIIQIASALGGTLEFFNGSLADVRIYNRALSQQEITTLYDSYRPKISLGSLMKGLVLDMPLNLSRYNAGNSKFDDLTPYENRGVNSGADVDVDHSTFISANSDNVRISDSESLSPTSAMTAMLWVKGAAQNGKGILSHWDYAIGQSRYLIEIINASPYNKFRILLSDDGTFNVGHRKLYNSSIIAFDNAWHLIGFSFDAGTLKLFVDRVEDPNPTKTNDDAITTIHGSSADIMVGCSLSSDTPVSFFDGDLARPKMWNRALTAAEWLLEYGKTKGLYL